MSLAQELLSELDEKIIKSQQDILELHQRKNTEPKNPKQILNKNTT